MSVTTTSRILIAGFGGQGILFAGKFLMYTGLIHSREVSWLPSYGPEMRGGTANCSIILSDSPVGSPIVTTPDILVVMNAPSLDKYENTCNSGAKIIVDSSLMGRKVERTDVDASYIPATALAHVNDLNSLANMIMIGKTIRDTGVCSYEDVKDAMKYTVPENKKDLLAANLRAVEMGYSY